MRRSFYLALGTSLWFASSAAWAQAPAAATPVPADPSATVAPAGEPAAAAAAPAASDAPVEAEPAKLEEARKHFRQGVAFAEAGNCGGAIVEFQAAYDAVPRPNALYNIAQCQERLFRYDLAIRFYEEYLRVAPADASDRPAVQAALGTLRNLLGVVAVASNVPAEVWVDDRLAGEAPGDVFVPAGGHTLEARAKGYLAERAEVKLVGGQRVEVAFTLEKARTTVHVTQTTGLDPIVFWAGVGATAVTAGVGGFFALRVSSLHSDAEKIPAVSPERASARGDIEDAELLADLFFGTSLVLAVGTTVVGFLTKWEASETPPADAGAGSAGALGLRVAPVASADGAGVVLGGAWP